MKTDREAERVARRALALCVGPLFSKEAFEKLAGSAYALDDYLLPTGTEIRAFFAERVGRVVSNSSRAKSGGISGGRQCDHATLRE